MANREDSDSESISMMESSLNKGEDDNDEAVDDAAHEKLLNSLFALDGKKRNKNEVRGISTPSGNLDLVVHAKKDASKIKPEDLKLKSKAAANLKKPVSSYEAELAKREIARETVKKEMDTWEPVVQEIRSAPQQIFSERPQGVEMKNAMRPKGFVPRTPLEKELFAALGQSEDVLNPNKDLTKAEERALKAMSVTEAMARRAELMKHHELLSRAQVRAKRVKKIKSKRYRKILRKEKEGAERKELERLQTEDPEAFVERLEQLEKDRMEERLTLKHRGGGKFARLHKVYSKFDDKTRDAMQTMLQKSRELTKKTGTISSSDDDDEEGEVTPVRADPIKATGESSASQHKTSRLEVLKAINKKAGGWLDGPQSTFVYTSGGKDAPESGQLSVGGVSETQGPAEEEMLSPQSKEKKVGKRKADSPGSGDEGEEEENSSDEEEQKNKKQKLSDYPVGDVCGEAPNKAQSSEQEEPKSKKRKRRRKKPKSGKEEEDGEPLKTKVKPVVESVLEVPAEAGGDDADGDAVDDDDAEDPLKVTMEELFQDEDVVEQFAREKAAAEERARPKVEDTRLPGWGNWAGPDYKERPPSKKQRRAEQRAKLLEKQRQKVQQPNVWLNPNNDDAIRKLQPKSVPFPYKSVQQYEASLRQPVSRGFVRETAFKLLNKPEVVAKLGHIIKPLDKEEIFKKKAEQEKAVEVQGGAAGLSSRGKAEDAGKTGSVKDSKKVRGGGAGKRKQKQKRRAVS